MSVDEAQREARKEPMSKSKIDGGALTLTEVADKIATSKGRYFGVTFTKKDKTTRRMTGRVGVHKDVSGKGMRYDPSVRSLRVVNETVIERGTDGRCRTVTRQYRTQPTDGRLTEIRISGKRHAVLPY